MNEEDFLDYFESREKDYQVENKIIIPKFNTGKLIDLKFRYDDKINPLPDSIYMKENYNQDNMFGIYISYIDPIRLETVYRSINISNCSKIEDIIKNIVIPRLFPLPTIFTFLYRLEGHLDYCMRCPDIVGNGYEYYPRIFSTTKTIIHDSQIGDDSSLISCGSLKYYETDDLSREILVISNIDINSRIANYKTKIKEVGRGDNYHVSYSNFITLPDLDTITDSQIGDFAKNMILVDVINGI